MFSIFPKSQLFLHGQFPSIQLMNERERGKMRDGRERERILWRYLDRDSETEIEIGIERARERES